MEAIVEVALTTEAPGARGYEIRIGHGAYAGLAEALQGVCPAHSYAIISDDRVAALYGEQVLRIARELAAPSALYSFPAGEAHKNRQTWIELSDRMLAAGHGRDSAVLALGGGVTGDLAGFVAATYLRGLPLVQLPTSLLAMIDSSVGGKTGVDVPAGKNLIGSFHQPRLVLADTATLHTLPAAEVRNGLAEAVKHGAIADVEYFDAIDTGVDALLRLDAEAMVRLIERSVGIKAAVVRADEREGGLRKTLNFGHTVGHAVEAFSGFALSHGQSISIGMVIEAAIGEQIGATRPRTGDRLREVLRRCGLPTAIPAEYDSRAILDLTRSDKKARAGRVEYALIERLGVSSRGTGSYGTPVEDEIVVEALERSKEQGTGNWEPGTERYEV